MTATGRETGRALFGDGVVQAWLPYDLPFAVRGFFDHFRPRRGLSAGDRAVAQPGRACARAIGIPLFLVNARMSRAFGARLCALPVPDAPAVRTARRRRGAVARRRGAARGARRARAGRHRQPQVRHRRARADSARSATNCATRFGATRPVWVAASTRDGEEALILDALAQAPLPRETLLVIVPRHPQRFADVAACCAARGVPFVRRSDNAARCPPMSASCSAIRWASCLRTTPPPTSPSSAAACCRSAGRT